MSKTVKVWLESIDSDGLYINFQVTPSYVYDITISKVGDPDDMRAGHGSSMWAWINHMSSKNWWNRELQEALIDMVAKNIHKYKK